MPQARCSLDRQSPPSSGDLQELLRSLGGWDFQQIGKESDTLLVDSCRITLLPGEKEEKRQITFLLLLLLPNKLLASLPFAVREMFLARPLLGVSLEDNLPVRVQRLEAAMALMTSQ